MSAESTPELTGVHVADDRDVEPLLRRAAADVSALTLRLGAATRRAAAAEAQADAAAMPTAVMLKEEEDALRRQLQQEQTERRRELDAELARVQAEASNRIDAARAFAIEVVRSASSELDVAVATFGETPTPLPIIEPLLPIEAPVVAVLRVETPPPVGIEPPLPVETPVEVEIEAPVDVVAPLPLEAPVDAEAPLDVEQSSPPFVQRLAHHETLAPVLTVLIVLIVLSLLVALVR